MLRDIIFGDRRYFRELLTRNDEGIASNILASRLRRLVDYGLLVKDDALRGQRARYTLTEAGIQTVPVLVALGSWGVVHRPTTPALAIRAQLLAAGGSELSEDLMDELREAHLGAPRPDPDKRRATERLKQAFFEVSAQQSQANNKRLKA